MITQTQAGQILQTRLTFHPSSPLLKVITFLKLATWSIFLKHQGPTFKIHYLPNLFQQDFPTHTSTDSPFLLGNPLLQRHPSCSVLSCFPCFSCSCPSCSLACLAPLLLLPLQPLQPHLHNLPLQDNKFLLC